MKHHLSVDGIDGVDRIDRAASVAGVVVRIRVGRAEPFSAPTRARALDPRRTDAVWAPLCGVFHG